MFVVIADGVVEELREVGTALYHGVEAGEILIIRGKVLVHRRLTVLRDRCASER